MARGVRSNPVGQVFGKLTVVELAEAGAKGKHTRWRCTCACGGEKITTWSNLQSGHAKSCGCAWKEAGQKRRKGDAAALTGWWKNITNNEKKRGLSVTIAKEEAIKIGQQPCHYCGDQAQVTTYYAAQYRHQALKLGCYDEDYYQSLCIQMNGLDRVDNSRGYEPDNVVACCRMCNRAKNDCSVDDFIAWARRLVATQERKALQQP